MLQNGSNESIDYDVPPSDPGPPPAPQLGAVNSLWLAILKLFGLA
jgi:hypothetical protein